MEIDRISLCGLKENCPDLLQCLEVSVVPAVSSRLTFWAGNGGHPTSDMQMDFAETHPSLDEPHSQRADKAEGDVDPHTPDLDIEAIDPVSGTSRFDGDAPYGMEDSGSKESIEIKEEAMPLYEDVSSSGECADPTSEDVIRGAVHEFALLADPPAEENSSDRHDTPKASGSSFGAASGNQDMPLDDPFDDDDDV